MPKASAEIVKVTIPFPKAALDFIDFLCSLSGETREEWFQSVLRQDIDSFLDQPETHWDRDHLTERFGLRGFLEEDKAPNGSVGE